MTFLDSQSAGGSRASLPPLQINPAVVVGLGAFGRVTLRLVAERLLPNHSALLDGLGWLWLDTAGWQENWLQGTAPDPAAVGRPPRTIEPKPWSQACRHATSWTTGSALRRAGYEVGNALDTIVVAHVDDPLAQGALWPLLELIRAESPRQDHRVTLILATDSRRIGGRSDASLGQFFDQLAQRLIADRTDPAPGAVVWCYLCDAQGVKGQLADDAQPTARLVAAQAELVAGFVGLLLASDLRCDQTYARTAIPELASDLGLPRHAALVSSFSWGAYVLPIDQILALVRDRVALRLYQAIFAKKTSVADREAGSFLRERLLKDIDLSPQGLRDCLSRDADGATISLDTTPPKLGRRGPEATLKALTRWREDLEACWDDETVSPAFQIERNATTFLAKVSEGIRRQVAAAVAEGPHGLNRALVFVEGLPQAIEDARVEVMADDRYYRKRTIPSARRELREIRELITERPERVWRDLVIVGLVVALGIVVTRWQRPDLWTLALALGSASLAAVLIGHFWRRWRTLTERRNDFISALKIRYQSAQERKLRVTRRGLFDGLLNVVREERSNLLACKRAIARAGAILAEVESLPLQPMYGEYVLCEPTAYPLPFQDVDDERLADLAAQHLDMAGLPLWPPPDARTVLAWLRDGVDSALAAWRNTVSVVGWTDPRPSQVIRDLAAVVPSQFPLLSPDHCQIELNIVGLPKRDRRFLPRRDAPDNLLVISTHDLRRFSYAPTRHGLELKRPRGLG